MPNKSKDKTKSTSRTRTRKKKKETKKPSPSTRVIWLYAAHSSLIAAAARRLLDFGSKESIQLRKAFDLTLNDHIMPVYPYPASKRKGVVEQLIHNVEDSVIVVLGLPTDRRNKPLHKLYEKAEVAWIHPPERQFYIDMMGETDSMTFQEAEQAMSEWKEFFSEHFEEKDINVIRA